MSTSALTARSAAASAVTAAGGTSRLSAASATLVEPPPPAPGVTTYINGMYGVEVGFPFQEGGIAAGLRVAAVSFPHPDVGTYTITAAAYRGWSGPQHLVIREAKVIEEGGRVLFAPVYDNTARLAFWTRAADLTQLEVPWMQVEVVGAWGQGLYIAKCGWHGRPELSKALPTADGWVGVDRKGR